MEGNSCLPLPHPAGGFQGGIQQLLQTLALAKADTVTAGSLPHVPTHCCVGASLIPWGACGAAETVQAPAHSLHMSTA